MTRKNWGLLLCGLTAGEVKVAWGSVRVAGAKQQPSLPTGLSLARAERRALPGRVLPAAVWNGSGTTWKSSLPAAFAVSSFSLKEDSVASDGESNETGVCW